MSFTDQFLALKISPAECADKPAIFSCNYWGARDPRTGFASILPIMIIPHHMDNQNRVPIGNPAAAVSMGVTLCRQCQFMHMNSDQLIHGGASDTGQHLTNTIEGLLFEGRHGSADALLNGTVFPMGAQCYGKNAESVGMEHEGNYMDRIPPRPQLVTSIRVMAWFCFTRGLDSAAAIQGHRDECSTLCPGNAFYEILPAVREAVHLTVLELKKNWSNQEGIWRN